MKILFFHRWVGVHGGGTETHLLELAKRFCRLGHDISILTREGNRLKDLDKKIKLIRVSKSFGESDNSYEDARVYLYTAIYMLKACLKLFLLKIKGEKFDIISVHFFVEAIIVRIYRAFLGTPFVFVLEGYTPLEGKAARFADSRIAISDFEAKTYKDKHGVDSERIYVGVDLSRFSADAQEASKMRLGFAQDNRVMILTVCRLEPRKDIFTLIEAAKAVNAINKDVKFVIVGDGISRAHIENSIRQNRLDPFVKLCGYVEDSELPYYYQAADIFVLTSRQEWFGIVFLEAMAAGLPIIATNVDAVPEIVNGCGLFFNKGNYKELAQKILYLVREAKLRRGLSLQARNRVINFDWDKQIQLYESAYKEALRYKC